MPIRSANPSRALSLLGAIASLFLGLLALLHGQSPPEFSPARFDPSDVYFQGYLASRRAEQFEASGDAVRAADQYRKASELFSSVRQYYPSWKPEMVKRRSEKTSKALAQTELEAKKQLDQKRSAVAELEGGIQLRGEIIEPNSPPSSSTAQPSILKVDPIATRRLEEAQNELKRLKRLVDQQESDKKRLREISENQSAIANAEIERIRRLSADDKAQAEAEIRRLRRETLLEKSMAESEIQRLQSITGETQKESQQKINQLQQLASSANANAAKELKRLEQLSGKSKQDAEAEIKRLQKLAAKSRADAQSEIDRLKQLTERTQSETADQLERALAAKANAEAKRIELDQINARFLSRINDLSSKGEQLEAKLKSAEANVSALRSQLAKAPVESEVDALNHKISQLDQERMVMSRSLRQSQTGYTEAINRISSLESELQTAKQKTSDLSRDLEAERTATNDVVTGQRRQLEALQKELNQKSVELASANQQIGNLKRELSESRDSFSQLRNERDALLLERDQMAALLKLNEAGRIQDLIEQNMALAKNLREANENVDRMYREGNADKDAITEALRDLAIAKSQINRLQQEKREQNNRLAEMEKRLNQEEKALASGEASTDAAEVAVLRDIIKRELRFQQRRKQARDLLIDAVKQLGHDDEKLAEAVELLDSQEIALTPEEQKLVADRQVDGEFVSPFARDRNTVKRATASLNQEITVFERTARKSFLAGRLLPTRELYEMILEQNPGHTPTLCKIGIVHLKLNETEAAIDSFKRAVELDNQNAYALRMLAYSLMKTEKFEDAEQAARESVNLAPNDPKTQMLLATICYRLGRQDDAEAHFKGAINANPLPSEPYYNLALIYSSSGRPEKAKQFYQQALERGALPDSKLEKSLKIH